jgi:hypothetical protein
MSLFVPLLEFNQIGNYTADGPEMAWYTPYLTPNIVNSGE